MLRQFKGVPRLLGALLSVVLLASPSFFCAASDANVQPKMIANPVNDPSRRLGMESTVDGNSLSSHVAAFPGSCSPRSPFLFPLSGGSGMGVIGVASADSITSITLSSSQDATGAIEISGTPQENLFGFDRQDHPMVALPFVFEGISADGATIVVTCSQYEPHALVLYRDDSDTEVKASVAFQEDGKQHIEISEGLSSEIELRGENGPTSKSSAVRFEGATKNSIDLTKTVNSQFSSSLRGYLHGSNPAPSEPTLIQLAVRSPDGRKFYRTLMAQVRDAPEPVHPVHIQASRVDENGDVVFTFEGVGKPGERLMVEVRVGISTKGHKSNGDQITDVVDLKAIVPSEDVTLIVHGGWIRRAADEHGLLSEGKKEWEVIIKSAVFSDPENGYRILGSIDSVVHTGIGSAGYALSQGNSHHHRALMDAPSEEERAITNEMRMGRRPANFVLESGSSGRPYEEGLIMAGKHGDRLLSSKNAGDGNNKGHIEKSTITSEVTSFPTRAPLNSNLATNAATSGPTNFLATSDPTSVPTGELFTADQSRAPATPTDGLNSGPIPENHKKIMVHGYCSKADSIPMEQFTDAEKFQDPAQGEVESPEPQSWSHDTFARKIQEFAEKRGITGCSCIAHSQGGAACLHLHTYYWSCFDNANQGGDRLIQTVGAPFLGTNIAGNAASLGQLFGSGCGKNNDLTHSGSEIWVAAIPSWARADVHYFTTSFTNVRWQYNYCHIVTDLFLSNPDDGAVAKDRGQLSGANDMGHKKGWCHTRGMGEPAQFLDSERNAEMNENARY